MKGLDFIGRDNFFARARTRIYSSLLALFIFSIPAMAAKKAQVSPIKLISNQNLEVCLPALEAVGASRDFHTVPELAGAFQKESRALVRRSIIDALSRINHVSAVPTLKLGLADPDTQVRQSAVAALGNSTSPAAQDALMAKAATESDPAVKTYLAQSLGRSRDKRAKDHLKRLAADGHSDVRRMANEELEKRSRIEKK